MSRILTIGSMNMDVTIFSERIPEQGETISGRNFLLSPGGKGANQSVAAARMGAEVAFVGCVGNDIFGNKLIDVLKADGIDTSFVTKIPDTSTGVAVITVCGGDNRIILYGGANDRVTCAPRAAIEKLIRGCDALMLQLEIPLSTVFEAVEIASSQKKPVFLTPAPANPLPKDLFQKVRYLLPNETEAGALLGRTLSSDQDMLDALVAFRGMGVREPIITLGERGVGCFVNGAPTIRDGYRVSAVDTTAAGDTFTGAFAAAVTEGAPVADAIDFAQKAAAICVTRVGAQNAIPYKHEVFESNINF